jgi:hypothetical protein
MLLLVAIATAATSSSMPLLTGEGLWLWVPPFQKTLFLEDCRKFSDGVEAIID